MKLIIKNLAAVSLLLLIVFFSLTVYADTWIYGYTKSNGTYVPGQIGTRNPSSYGDNSGVRNRSWDRSKKRQGNRSRSP